MALDEVIRDDNCHGERTGSSTLMLKQQFCSLGVASGWSCLDD